MQKIKIPDLDKTQLNKLLLLIGGLLIFIFVSIFFVFRSQIKTIRGCISQSHVFENNIYGAKAKIIRKKELLLEIEKIKESLAQYEKKLPREKDVPFLLEELTQIVELGDIEFVSIRPRGASPIEELIGRGGEGVYLRMPIEITMRCGFHDLEKFLFHLENTRRFVKVVDLEIKGGLDKGPQHSIRLLIEIYMYKEADSAV